MTDQVPNDYVVEILRSMPDGLDEFQFLRRCIADIRGGYDEDVVAAFRVYVAEGRHLKKKAVK
jgi:hypothetical protein